MKFEFIEAQTRKLAKIELAESAQADEVLDEICLALHPCLPEFSDLEALKLLNQLVLELLTISGESKTFDTCLLSILVHTMNYKYPGITASRVTLSDYGLLLLGFAYKDHMGRFKFAETEVKADSIAVLHSEAEEALKCYDEQHPPKVDGIIELILPSRPVYHPHHVHAASCLGLDLHAAMLRSESLPEAFDRLFYFMLDTPRKVSEAPFHYLKGTEQAIKFKQWLTDAK